MSSPEKTSGLIGVSRIAEIADVRASAVSNWRRRHKDFPSPRAGSGRQTMFDIEEVEAWLLDNGKIEERIAPGLRVLAILDAASIDAARAEGSGAAVTSFFRAALVYLVACRRSGASDLRVPVEVASEDTWSSVRDKSEVLEALAGAAARIESTNEPLSGMLGALVASPEEASLTDLGPQLLDLLDETLDSDFPPLKLLDLVEENEVRRDPGRASVSVTPRDLIRLFKALAPTKAEAVLDPAAGSGRLLSEISEQVNASQAFAAEINARTELAVRQRLFVADIQSEVALTSSLEEEEWPKVDLVVLDPPLGLSSWGRPEDYGSDRWRFGAPPPNSADLAWVQLGVLPLNKGGTGLVVSTPGALFRGGREAKIRKSMVKAGVIEAIITLPPGLLTHTQIQLALWVLRSTESARPDSPILMIDGSGLHSIADDFVVQQISQLVKNWRQGTSGTATAESPGPRVLDMFRELAVSVSPDELDKDYALTPRRFLPSSETDVEVLRDKHQSLGQYLTDNGNLGFDQSLLKLPRVGPFEKRRLGDMAQILKGHIKLEPEDDMAKELLGEVTGGAANPVSRIPKDWAASTPGSEDSVAYLLTAPRGGWNWQVFPRDFLKGDEEQALPGDVAAVIKPVSSRRTQVRTTLLRDDGWTPVIPGAGIWLIRAHDPEELLPGWIACFLGSEDFRNQLRRVEKPGIVSSISKKEFEAVEIPVPSLEGQTELVQAFEQLETYRAQASQAARQAGAMSGMLVDLATAEAEDEVE